MRTELRRLFALALPLAAAEAGTQIMSVVDMAVIGRLGGLELAAAGLGNAVFFGVAVFGLGLMLGVDPLISQAVGARDFVSARRVMWQGIWLALITSAVLTVLLLCGPFLLRTIGVKPEIIGPASSFLLIRTIGLAPWLVFFRRAGLSPGASRAPPQGLRSRLSVRPDRGRAPPPNLR